MSDPFHRMSVMDRLLIFDGDDTLWATEHLYDAARNNVRSLVAEHGLNPDEWETIERQRDVENVAVHGMSAHRFPTSCVEALDEVAGRAGHVIPSTFRDLVWREAESVFTARPHPMPAVREVLEVLASEYVMVLLTKGDPAIQARRVDDSGLRHLFVDVEVVAEKLPSTFTALARRSNVRPEDATSIGNSLASDIRPAVEAGLHAIWIDAHVWEYERDRSDQGTVPDSVQIVGSLRDLPAALGIPGAVLSEVSPLENHTT